ncbi:MAG: YdcF family protein [Clostridiales bacterium]|nr:YdcF family protein [Clostridiales bacterium]
MIKKLRMMGKLEKAVTAVGAVLCLYAVFYSLRSNFNIGNLLILGAGLVFLIWPFVPENRFFTVIKRLILIGTAFYIFMAGFIFFQGQSNKADFTEDAVVVLGCGVRGTRISLDLKQRLDKAYEYYCQNPNCVICVSGGQGPQEDIAEGEAMRLYLEGLGVPAEKIIKEDKASSTKENFAFSKILLDEYFAGDYSIAYITNDFHSYRAGLFAVDAGFSEISSYPSASNLMTFLPNYMREVLAVLYKWVFKG